MKPVIYGYVSAPPESTAEQVEAKRRVLAAFALREGYALAHVYEERGAGGPALGAVIEVSREAGAAAVVILSLADLSSLPRVAALTVERIRREAGVPVLAAQAAS